MDKLKFWKGRETLEPLKPIGSGEESAFGKPERSPFGEPEGFGKAEGGFGRDATPGLGGGSLGEDFESRAMKVPESNQPQDVDMVGPSYDRPPESGDLRHAPLAPMERPAFSGPAGGSQQVPQEIQVMAAKIDAIKAHVEAINHRLESIERMMMSQQKDQRYQW